jgi:hypothetical protein
LQAGGQANYGAHAAACRLGETREQAAQKYRCLICTLLLLWIHDVLDSSEAIRVHKPVIAA